MVFAGLPGVWRVGKGCVMDGRWLKIHYERDSRRVGTWRKSKELKGYELKFYGPNWSPNWGRTCYSKEYVQLLPFVPVDFCHQCGKCGPAQYLGKWILPAKFRYEHRVGWIICMSCWNKLYPILTLWAKAELNRSLVGQLKKEITNARKAERRRATEGIPA